MAAATSRSGRGPSQSRYQCLVTLSSQVSAVGIMLKRVIVRCWPIWSL